MKYIYKIFIASIIIAPFVSSAATLSVSPSSQAMEVGSNFSVNINLNTTGSGVEGVDLLYLKFNPNILEVVDASSSLSGVQITPGTLMPNTVFNTVNNSSGSIGFSQVANGGASYNGSGIFATINFRAKAVGTSPINFDFTLGSTLDSNVAANGSDVLVSVTNGSFTVSSPIPPSTPPSSSGGGGSSGGGSSGSGSSSSGSSSSSSGSSGSSSSSSSGSSSSPRSSSGTSASSAIISTTKNYPSGSINKNLSFRSEGPDVLILQKFLVAEGLLTADNATGFFGPITESALKAFQITKNIVNSGSVETTGFGAAGPKTRAFINAMLSSTSVSTGATVAASPSGITTGITTRITKRLERKSEGSEVTLLQRALVKDGYMTADNISGYFGPVTEGALKRFQADYQIVTSGNPTTTGFGASGPKTREILNWVLAR